MKNNQLLLRPKGVSNVKWYFIIWKRYFDTGFTMTGYIKYAVALFGISSLNVEKTLIIGFIYGIACFFIGWAWFRYQFAEIDAEISNRYNWFVQDMRDLKENVESNKRK